MINQAAVGDKLVAALRAEACRIEDDCMTSHAAHNEEARLATHLHLYLGISATVLAAAAGVSSLSSLSLVAGIVSFGVAALSGLMTFLDPKSRSSEHYQAGIAYATLRTDTRWFRTVECEKNPRPSDLESRLSALATRWKDLDKGTPVVSGRALALAAVRIEAGVYSYDGDCIKGRHVVELGAAVISGPVAKPQVPEAEPVASPDPARV